MRDPRWEIGAGIWQDNKTARDLKWEIKAGIKVGIRAGTRICIRAGIEQNNKKEENLGWKDKEDPTRIQSFANRHFFLATHLFFFFTTSSSESVTIWLGFSTLAN